MKTVVALALAAAFVAPAAAAPAAPVTKLRAAGFGYVLARRDRQALYYWQVEKKAGGEIRCVGPCAAAWPPPLLPSAGPPPPARRRPRRARQALYYWQVEKKAGGKIRCVGPCAAAWPPLLVRSAGALPRHVAGIKGTFGVIRRPNGRLQVTHNGVPVYTYAHEGPGQGPCNNVDGRVVLTL